METINHILVITYSRFFLTVTFIFIENCGNVNLQLAIASGIVIVRKCSRISLSVCCERLIMEY